MKTISIARRPINETALHEELVAELGADYIGLSTTPQELVLHFATNAASDAMSLAQIIVKSHDPLKLTTAQIAEKQRLLELEESRTQYPKTLDLRLYASETALIVELAERLRRLELLIGDKDVG
jgi:hypothetical protein